MKVADYKKGKDKTQTVQIPFGGGGGNWPDQAEEELVYGVLARPPQPEAGQGDAHLGHRKQPSGVGKQAQGSLCTRYPFLRKLPQTGMPDREQRNFSACKKPVYDNNQNDQ